MEDDIPAAADPPTDDTDASGAEASGGPPADQADRPSSSRDSGEHPASTVFKTVFASNHRSKVCVCDYIAVLWLRNLF